MTDDEDDLSWASSLTGEALDALGGVDQFQEALGSGGHDVREAVQAAGGAILLSEALASIAEALDAAGGAELVAEALDAAGGLDAVAEAISAAGGADAVHEAVMIASRLGPT